MSRPGRPRRERGSTPTRREKSGPRGLGGDRVEGRHAVRELLLAGTRKTRQVYLASGMDPAPILDEIIDLADEVKAPIREIGRGKFDSMARTDAPQGVLAEAAPLTETDPDELAAAAQPFLLLLDGITDAGNLGAILRTAECAGVTGVLLPKHRQVKITPAVTKSAAGAIEHLPMALVGGLPNAISRLRDQGVWIVGLDVAADQRVADLQLADAPVALVLGAEGRGLSRLVRERCDVVATIPLRGALGSLNVSAAAAVACFAVSQLRYG